MKKIIVTGAGGFIGGHLVKKFLKFDNTEEILAVDIKQKNSWFQIFNNKKLKNLGGINLRNKKECIMIFTVTI